ncbi:MAG: VOC family protein [Nitrospira sp.]|nr:VOC family protein [Nitrospira sp.]
MNITEAAFIGYPVSDIKRARNFYENLLGLTPGEFDHEIEGMPGKYWIEYDIGNVTLAISNTWEPSGQGGPSVALEVENFEDAVSKLKAADVTILADRIESPVCCFALITDPDGNGITIHKRKGTSACKH